MLRIEDFFHLPTTRKAKLHAENFFLQFFVKFAVECVYYSFLSIKVRRKVRFFEQIEKEIKLFNF